MLLIWSGLGLLVPGIAIVCSLSLAAMLGQSMPPNALNFITALTTAVILAAAGMELRRREVRRHFYWIPMEYWSIAAGAIALACVPGFFNAA